MFNFSEKKQHGRSHAGEKLYKCKYCDKCFIQSGDKTKHEKIHTGEKLYKCNYCDKCFIQSGGKNRHEKTHTPMRDFIDNVPDSDAPYIKDSLKPNNISKLCITKLKQSAIKKYENKIFEYIESNNNCESISNLKID